ncbi:MAG: hypothetical protein ABSE21_11625 [Bryobacteraceae bacterium]|jgi:hypothetical protein
MRLKRFPACLAILLAAACGLAAADDANSKEAIKKSLQSQYALTKATADKKDIVTAGTVLVLQKDNLTMGESTASPEFTASYQDGKIKTGTVGAASKLNQKVPGFLRGHVPGASSAPSPGQRTFVAGEKMWVTKIEVREDSVLFDLFTDAYSDVRYSVALAFKFPKGIQLTADQVAKLVGDVFKVQPAEEEKAGNNQQQGGAQPAQPTSAHPAAPAGAQPPVAAEAPLAPIEPPPPPADQPPPTITIGQTIDQVTAAMGQPLRKAVVGKKTIYFYKDLKVTFVDNKVSDVQ